jgi:nicotinate-nucleotide pyrophosphorylase (carboxylating)
MELTHEDIERVVAAALAEDVGAGDATTLALVPDDAQCRAELLLEEPGVVCGVPVAAAVFRALDPAVHVEAKLEEGTAVSDVPAVLAAVEGPARAVLSGERVALNLVGRLCGIASLTRRFVELTEGTATAVLDTRKTTPGLRALEKYAVRCGGGRNHRFGLDDAVLLKENHLRIAGGIGPAVAALRNGRPVEVEAEREQPAPRSGRSTVFSGERILAVSAMKWTPQKTIVPASVAAAWRESPSESPT